MKLRQASGYRVGGGSDGKEYATEWRGKYGTGQ